MQNNNKTMLDRPIFEQLTFSPVTGIGGTNICDDGYRFAYTYFQQSASVAQFHRYDTWTDSWQQLATPTTQTGTVANMTFVNNVGGQLGGKTYGTVYLFVGNGTVCYLYKYDIATNIWNSLSTTNIPATFGTDCYLISLSPDKNNWDATYHSGVTRTITTSASTAVGATTISVGALPEALVAGTRLRFGTFNITLTAQAVKGAETISISALGQSLAQYTILTLTNGDEVILSTAATAGATSLSVFPIQKDIANATVIRVDLYVVLTAGAAVSATSITVSALNYSIPSSANAYYYGNMYLVGNNATQLYRYNIGTNTWATTSANSGNPALPALPGTIGAGCGMKWIPGIIKDRVYILRGGGTTNIYYYDLVANTVGNVTYYPNSELFAAGTSMALRQINGKGTSMLIQQNGTGKVFEPDILKSRMESKFTQWLYPQGAAVVGDKGFCITSPDGIEFYYLLLNSSQGFVRTALLDS